MLDRIPLAVQLRSYWRVLFRAAVMRTIDRDIDSGILGEANCLKRLEHFGLAARAGNPRRPVAEHLLTSDADATLRYRAFAALYLDLASFEPEAVGHYFPSLPAGPAVSHLLADGLDAEHLLAAMRPSGAADAILEADQTKARAPRGRAGPIRQTGPIAAGGRRKRRNGGIMRGRHPPRASVEW